MWFVIILVCLMILIHLYDKSQEKRKYQEMQDTIKRQHDEYLKKQEEEKRERARQEEQRRLKEEQEALERKKIEKQQNAVVVNERSSSQPENSRADASQDIQSYFDGYSDILICKIFAVYDLVPLRTKTLENDVKQIVSIQNDLEIRKCMPYFCGIDGQNNFREYLLNTYACTEMGIAFGYAIRQSSLMDPMNASYGPMMGMIKVTTPSHNVVTNNFNGWLIDYFMLPQYRGKGLMKMAIGSVLEVIEDFNVENVYAMVDNENFSSIKVLISNGFRLSKLPGGLNPHTNTPYSIYVHKF